MHILVLEVLKAYKNGIGHIEPMSKGFVNRAETRQNIDQSAGNGAIDGRICLRLNVNRPVRLTMRG